MNNYWTSLSKISLFVSGEQIDWSVVLFTHIIYSQTQLDDLGMSRPLFVGTRGGISANKKEEQFALKDNSI